ncbi:MAG TPA: glycosyltransferase [Candidatus Dormibacteraeota bacterium]
MGLRIALDLRPGQQPRWARALAGALQAAGAEHEWLTDPRTWKTADLVLALTGARPRFGPPAWTAVHEPRTGWGAAWTARQSERLLAPSDLVAGVLHTYLRVPAHRIVRLPPVVPEGFKRARRPEVEAFRQRHGLPDRWLAALAPHPASAAGLPVFPVYEIPDAELPAAYSGAVAALDPHPRRGNPSGVLEAMACGAPAVVVAGSAGGEVIADAGVLVAAGDRQGWLAAIEFLVHDQQERNRLAARALRTGERFRAEVAARRLLAELGAAARAGTRAAGAG